MTAKHCSTPQGVTVTLHSCARGRSFAKIIFNFDRLHTSSFSQFRLSPVFLITAQSVSSVVSIQLLSLILMSTCTFGLSFSCTFLYRMVPDLFITLQSKLIYYKYVQTSDFFRFSTPVMPTHFHVEIDRFIITYFFTFVSIKLRHYINVEGGIMCTSKLY